MISAFQECPRDAAAVWIGEGRAASLRQVHSVRAAEMEVRVDGAGVELWVEAGVDHDDRALRENPVATGATPGTERPPRPPEDPPGASAGHGRRGLPRGSLASGAMRATRIAQDGRTPAARSRASGSPRRTPRRPPRPAAFFSPSWFPC